ncbi:hypothetical protein RAH41_08150 [Gottfriedia acidiceleris]|uniref:hypothetical protein n=1 Tax=Gottfriedia acidiceleris TaxID=371036 RepID=UPI002F26C07F
MPKVKMLVSMVGNEFNYVPGDIVEVREDVAESWTTNFIAEIYVPPEEKVLTHVEEAVEEEKTEEPTKEEKPKRKGKKKEDE